MTMTTLPPEVLLRIFSNLGYRDLMSARRTCRQWRDLSMDEGLLRTIKERDFREEQWGEERYCPSDEEIGLAVFLGRNRTIEILKWILRIDILIIISVTIKAIYV